MNRDAEDMLIERAAGIIRSGGLVAFPTETVYGLGADATNSTAVKKIFAAKGRPATNPLIVHVTGEEMANRFVTHWPPSAAKLSSRFWPGPLTLVLPATNDIAGEVTAGLGTVGLRAPNHPLAQKLIHVADRPIAAPSANRSQRISPTTAEHVRQEIGERVDLILDGGPCTVGIESTVLDLSAEVPAILRPGGITQAQLQEVIGEVLSANTAQSDAAPARSPGQQAIHYSPRKPTFRFGAEEIDRLERFIRNQSDKSAAVIALAGSAILPRINQLGSRATLVLLPSNPTEYARNFYSALRSADADRSHAIWIQLPPAGEPWDALRDRITRASRPAADAG
jgi:L-threonylcarbamoyladenylate synthase